MRYRIVRKTNDGFEIQEFAQLHDAIKERNANGGFVDYYDETFKCWKQLKKTTVKTRREK